MGLADVVFKVYDNISFDALGAVLNLDADAAEITARK
jgi:hypothetical protein